MNPRNVVYLLESICTRSDRILCGAGNRRISCAESLIYISKFFGREHVFSLGFRLFVKSLSIYWLVSCSQQTARNMCDLEYNLIPVEEFLRRQTLLMISINKLFEKNFGFFLTMCEQSNIKLHLNKLFETHLENFKCEI